jgi:hypothetical protein
MVELEGFPLNYRVIPANRNWQWKLPPGFGQFLRMWFRNPLAGI